MQDKTTDAIEQLIVKERLHELEMAYCRGTDRRDLELLKSIYFDDALEDHGDAWRGTGHEWAEYAITANTRRFETTAHYVLNEWYKVDGMQAQGETHRISYHREPSGLEITAASRTFNRYECRDGVWKIVWRSVTRDWLKESHSDPGLTARQEKHYAAVKSRPGADDRSYTDVPWFRRGSSA